jgi:RsiW-degrading membrane proteinase PrsW (M82 family)
MGPALAIVPIMLALGSRLSSRGTVAIAVAMGLLAALGSLVGLIFLPFIAAIKLAILKTAANAFLGEAIPEEATKLLVLMTIVLRHHEAVPRRDAILLAGWLGLGFALFENFFYVTNDHSWLVVGTIRAATAVPSHVAFGLIMGHYLTRAMEGRSALFPAFCVPAMLHGLYDWSLMQLSASWTPFSIVTLMWGCAFALALIITWLFVRGPVSNTLRELQAEFGARHFDCSSISDRVADTISSLLLIVAGLILLIAVGAALTVKIEYGTIGVLALMPTAFADLRRHGRLAAPHATGRLPMIEQHEAPPTSPSMAYPIEGKHRPSGPLIPPARIALALSRPTDIVDETG